MLIPAKMSAPVSVLLYVVKLCRDNPVRTFSGAELNAAHLFCPLDAVLPGQGANFLSEAAVGHGRNAQKRRGCLAGFLPRFGAVLLLFACSGLLAAGVIYGCSHFNARSSGTDVASGTPPGTAPASPSEVSPSEASPSEAAPSEAVPSETAPPETVPPETVPVTGAVSYEFGTALGERERVADEWFDGAVFLGDSRTEGLQLFGGLAHGDFYWHRGMNVFRADDSKYAYFDSGGEKTTLLGTLRVKKYKAVYLMLGINELGYQEEAYSAALSELVDGIIEAQPEAVIYLQTMPPVNDQKARDFDISPYINTKNVNKFNEAIARIAEEKRVVLLDTASIYRGPDGQLPSELTGDGVHFTSSGYKRWADFLRTHTMEPEEYLKLRDMEE